MVPDSRSCFQKLPESNSRAARRWVSELFAKLCDDDVFYIKVLPIYRVFDRKHIEGMTFIVR